MSYSYNDKGLLSKKLEGKRSTVYSYDNMNRLIKIEVCSSAGVPPVLDSGRPAPGSSAGVPPVASSSITLLSYNSAGKLISIADESGKIEFAYDSFGRITSEKGAVGEIRYEYNNIGLLSGKECMFSRKDAKAQSFRTDYSYDNFDRLTQVSSPAGTYSYTYDSKGRIASLAFGNVSIKNDYDKAGRLVSKSLSPAVNGLSGEALAKSGERSTENGTLLCAYEYDKLDRRVKAEVNGVKWSYGYDEFNQLTSASPSDGYIYGYGFDKIGNRLSSAFNSHGSAETQSYKYNSLNQIASASFAQSVGSLFAYDAYGNLIKSQDAEYTYDLQNRLIEVKKTNLTVKYSYDSLGQRIKSEEIFNAKDARGAKVTQFLMSGMVEQARITDSVAQYHTLGLDLAQSLTATGGVGAVLASTTGSDSFNYLYDGNGNVISTCNSKGEITAKLAYSPFGEKLSGADLPFNFSTKSSDSSGLTYYGYRFYSPEIGRWTNRDPVKDQGGYNYYVFALNNTLNNLDIIGLISIIVSSTNDNEINVVIDTSGGKEGCEVNTIQLAYKGGKWQTDVGGTSGAPLADDPFYMDKNDPLYENWMRNMLKAYNEKHGTNYSYPNDIIFYDAPGIDTFFYLAVVERCCTEKIPCCKLPDACTKSKITIVQTLQWKTENGIAKIVNSYDEASMKTLLKNKINNGKFKHLCPSKEDPFRYVDETNTIE